MSLHVGAFYCMGAYKPDVVIVIKMGAYIHGVLICVGAYYPDFTVPVETLLVPYTSNITHIDNCQFQDT